MLHSRACCNIPWIARDLPLAWNPARKPIVQSHAELIQALLQDIDTRSKSLYVAARSVMGGALSKAAHSSTLGIGMILHSLRLICSLASAPVMNTNLGSD